MQHVGLTVNNIYPKFHKILRTFKKDMRSQREFLFFFLETGSEETGSSKAYFARYRLSSSRWYKKIFQTSSCFLRILDRNVSRKRIIIIIKKQNNNRSFRRSRKALIIVRNRVKAICSQTSFGEHNNHLLSASVLIKILNIWSWNLFSMNRHAV